MPRRNGRKTPLSPSWQQNNLIKYLLWPLVITVGKSTSFANEIIGMRLVSLSYRMMKSSHNLSMLIEHNTSTSDQNKLLFPNFYIRDQFIQPKQDLNSTNWHKQDIICRLCTSVVSDLSGKHNCMSKHKNQRADLQRNKEKQSQSQSQTLMQV